VKSRAKAKRAKAKRSKAKRSKAKRAETSYPGQLKEAISQLLPRGLATVSQDGRVRWVERLLVVCAILVAWGEGQTLVARFTAARACVVEMFPSRRRPGETYEGFIGALEKVSWDLLGVVAAHLRGLVRGAAQAAGCWEVCGWAAFGADGSKVDCPMTRANEAGLGVASRANSWPQMLLAVMFHAGSGLPWAFERGGARASERSLLLRMLGTLPVNALLLLDAGFTGYDLLQAILGGGRSFVVRVGSNVHLLTKLGYAVEERDGIVYLTSASSVEPWPEGKQKKQCQPMVLRLITFADGRNRKVHLLTDVLEAAKLSDAAALQLYELRWGAELTYRSLKQTLGRRKMLSDCPEHAAVELDWAVVGLWMLDLMNARAAGLSAKRSCASALHAVREAIDGRCPCPDGKGGRGGRGALARALAAAVADGYRRTGSKKARHWPSKKKEKPPGDPKVRTATPAEVLLAQRIRAKQDAEKIAA
jgi:AcrR family transcriptional regulator